MPEEGIVNSNGSFVLVLLISGTGGKETGSGD
jgi:hypothetical protein